MAVFVAYSLQAERSFLFDEGATYSEADAREVEQCVSPELMSRVAEDRRDRKDKKKKRASQVTGEG